MIINNFQFINFPAIRFKRPTAETLDEFSRVVVDKFDHQEDLGQAWRSACWNAFLNGDNDKLQELQREHGAFYVSDRLLDFLIDEFTLKDGTKSQMTMENIADDIVKYSKFYKFISFDFEKGQIIIRTTKGTFKANKLTKVFPKLLEKTDYLETDQRHQHCHVDAISLLKNLEDKCVLATGYVTDSGKFAKYLHSWIEIDIHGEPFVIDTTRNLLMRKRGYYMIYNIDGPVHKISKKAFLKDEPKLKRLTDYNDWFSKLYLANRRQALEVSDILKDLEEKRKMEDPLYQAAKHFHDCMVKHLETKPKKKVETKHSQKGE